MCLLVSGTAEIAVGINTKGADMNKYRVSVKYSRPGSTSSSTQDVVVEAESDQSAMQLAVNKLKTSNSAYRDVNAVAIKVKKI